jgi:IclR family transcriptional regulator, KDG regulon repressor
MPAEQIQTLSRAVAVLDCFTLDHSELGVREIARMVNLSSSATGRLLAALKEMGILSQNPETRAYSMGARVLTWAGVYTSTLDVRNRAMVAIEELHQSTRETISLYVREGTERVCVERLESSQSVRIVARLGKRLPLYAGAAGKVLLAYLSPQQQEDFFRSTPLVALTVRTVVDHDQLRSELQRVRERGCAVSFGEWIDDAAGVAAPVMNQAGEAIAALTISGPIQRFNKENVAIYCQEVKRFAARISKGLGYAGDFQ